MNSGLPIREGEIVPVLQPEPVVSGRTIGDVMEEMWCKAIDLKAQELFFEFNGHIITIKEAIK